MIRFVNNIEDIPEYPLSRTILIDDSLQSEREVIDIIEQALDSPYDKDNWDGFYEVLRDLQWMKESQVVLIHKSLPSLTSWDLHIYLDILEDIAKPTDSTKDFEVYFLVDDKEKIDFFLPGKFPQPEVKGKRAPATHIGDIFEIPLPGDRKRYMQFILVDSSQLGAWTVRVFKTDYSIDDQPSIDVILDDRIDFYMNTRDLGRGILYSLWVRYGKSDNLGDLSQVVFRTFDRAIPGVHRQRWRVWRASQIDKYYRVLPRRFIKVDYGAMAPPFSVIRRIVTGRWYPVANVYDDYKGASFFDRLLGREIVPTHLAPTPLKTNH